MSKSGEEEKAHLIMKLRGSGISSASVLKAIENIPRELFVESALRNHAWENVPLPIGNGQTISQPFIVSLMTKELNLTGREIVLEIGTGSGYQAAVLSLLCRRVYSIERIKNLHLLSNKRLEDLGLTNITTRHGNGALGWFEVAPFDCIIITCATEKISTSLFNQLKIGGRLIAPEKLVNGKQSLNLYTCFEKGRFKKKSLGEVQFVPMR
tara:strand:+ start:115 stop:744 length:630 start_codon:yes stop_codon:yes gene_type:complete